MQHQGVYSVCFPLPSESAVIVDQEALGRGTWTTQATQAVSIDGNELGDDERTGPREWIVLE